MGIPLHDVAVARFRRTYTYYTQVLTPRSLTDGRQPVCLSFFLFLLYYITISVVVTITRMFINNIYSTSSDVEIVPMLPLKKSKQNIAKL